MLLQVRQGRPFVSLEPQRNGGYLVRTAVPIGPTVPGRERLVVQAVYPVAERLGALADTVQAAYQQYGEKDYLRKPLKASFILTLTVVLLLSLLAAWYGAIFTAQRLVQPIQDLVKGTRAVAQGDLDTRLPMTSHDEMGFLVHSFNDMTKRLRRAREDQQRAQQAAETERANLAVILARLSTGVVSLEPDLRVRTANRAASMILGDDLETRVGQPLASLGPPESLLRPVQRIGARSASPPATTSGASSSMLASGSGRRVLMCACTPLPGEGDAPGGFRARLRRHHRDAAGATRSGLGRGRASAGARDQEPAHADPALRRAHAAQAAAGDGGRRKRRSSTAARRRSCSRSRR